MPGTKFHKNQRKIRNRIYEKSGRSYHSGRCRGQGARIADLRTQDELRLARREC